MISGSVHFMMSVCSYSHASWPFLSVISALVGGFWLWGLFIFRSVIRLGWLGCSPEVTDSRVYSSSLFWLFICSWRTVYLPGQFAVRMSFIPLFPWIFYAPQRRIGVLALIFVVLLEAFCYNISWYGFSYEPFASIFIFITRFPKDCRGFCHPLLYVFIKDRLDYIS